MRPILGQRPRSRSSLNRPRSWTCRGARRGAVAGVGCAGRTGWLELLWVASPGGLPGVGTCPSGAGGTGLGICGGIGPNLGPLRTAVANITSQRLHAAEVASWEVGVIFLQETKLPRRGGRRPCATFFAKRGWQCGDARWIPRGGGMWNTPEGGVSSLVREGLTAELVRHTRV